MVCELLPASHNQTSLDEEDDQDEEEEEEELTVVEEIEMKLFSLLRSESIEDEQEDGQVGTLLTMRGLLIPSYS